jgi:hypothetical protein
MGVQDGSEVKRERVGRGRPSTYRAEFVEQARKLAKLGAVTSEIAEFMEVDERTIRRWRHTHPEFDEALTVGAEAANNRVQTSLYNQAVGYWVDDEEIKVINGNIVRVKVRRFIPPNASAAIYWTKAKMGWSDRPEGDESGDDTPPDLAEKSPRDIARAILYALHMGNKEEAPS